jgi:hypothetical protein
LFYFIYYYLLAILFEQDPTQGHKRYKYYKVHHVVVTLVFEYLAYDRYEEYECNGEVFSLDKEINILDIVGCK